MRLNRLEFVLMNNPIRAALQRWFEAPRLLRMGGPVTGGTALEIGCGHGIGVTIILNVFGASHVDAFDLDPNMIARARRRLGGRIGNTRLWVGSATKIDAPDSAYDAVFDFGVLHHIPDWRSATTEIHRVLKPGGLFYAEEVLSGVLDHPFVRRLFDHPRKDRFDSTGFLAALRSSGLTPINSNQLLRCFAWFVAKKPLTP